MKFLIVLIAVLSVAQCAVFRAKEVAPVTPKESDDQKAETLRLESENNGLDKYSFAYDTSNGISRSEQGELKTVDDEHSAIVVQGTTAWDAPDGKRYEIVFTADELGYHPIFRIASQPQQNS